MKTNALDFKFLADELVKIDISRNHVAPNQIRRAILSSKRATKLI